MGSFLSVLRNLRTRIKTSFRLRSKSGNSYDQDVESSIGSDTKSLQTKQTSTVNDSDSMSDEQTINFLLSNFLFEEAHRHLALIPRFQFRLNILKAWNIPTGSRVLDIGCGQGESVLTLASQLGPHACITGIDTAPPNYGSPITVSQTQEFIRSTPLGKQITFAQSDAASYLSQKQSSGQEKRPEFDAATLCLSIWYFPTPESVAAVFQTLAKAGIPKVFLADYDYKSTMPEQQPHVLAARAQALLHAYKIPPDVANPLEQNVRAAPEVGRIREAALAAGYTVAREGRFTPAKNMLEGHFEARFVMNDRFKVAVQKENLDPQQEEEVMSYVPRVTDAMQKINDSGVEKGRAMDLWWVEFRL